MTDRIRDMLHTKEQLLLDVSHELRSPLTRVRVALEFLPEGKARESIADDVSEPEEELSFIFEPFYRVDKSRSKDTGGYGLGLSLCKTIMEAHDGKIEIASKAGEGTTVSLFFST